MDILPKGWKITMEVLEHNWAGILSKNGEVILASTNPLRNHYQEPGNWIAEAIDVAWDTQEQIDKESCVIPNRVTTHPGEVLREDFLKPMGITVDHLAYAIVVPIKQVADILDTKRPVTPKIAEELARFFGTSEELWLNLQTNYDLFKARAEKESHDNAQRT